MARGGRESLRNRDAMVKSRLHAGEHFRMSGRARKSRIIGVASENEAGTKKAWSPLIEIADAFQRACMSFSPSESMKNPASDALLRACDREARESGLLTMVISSFSSFSVGCVVLCVCGVVFSLSRRAMRCSSCRNSSCWNIGKSSLRLGVFKIRSLGLVSMGTSVRIVARNFESCIRLALSSNFFCRAPFTDCVLARMLSML